jgi:tetratricopeptide (TPR) repeat protein
VLGQAGEGDRGRKVLEDWVRREPRDKTALRALGNIYASASRWQDVTDVCRKLADVEEGKGLVDAVVHLAEASERSGRPLDARDRLEEVFMKMPWEPVLRSRLRLMYERAGAHRELAELSLADAEYAQDDAACFRALVRAGETYVRRANDPGPAVAPLEQALKLRPGDAEATVLLADAYTASGRTQEAEGLLRAAIDTFKGRRARELAPLQHRMARLASASGDRKAGLAWLSSALENDMQNGEVASELAEIAMEFGQTEIALKALRAVALMKTVAPMSRATAFLRQGVIAYQQKDVKKAMFFARKALSEDPSLKEAETFLKEIGDS